MKPLGIPFCHTIKKITTMKMQKVILPFTVLLLMFAGNSFSQINQSDRDALIYTMQEEKVANNFYTAMQSLYGMNVFENISKAETMHMKHVKTLLDDFGIDNPVSGKYEAAGSFMDAGLEKMYNDMISVGNISVTDALKESAKFEEMDIRDLKAFVESTQNTSIKSTLNMLINASGNHLRAFVKNLRTRGIEYTPQYLSQEEFNGMISSSGKSRGNGNCIYSK